MGKLLPSGLQGEQSPVFLICMGIHALGSNLFATVPAKPCDSTDLPGSHTESDACILYPSAVCCICLQASLEHCHWMTRPGQERGKINVRVDALTGLQYVRDFQNTTSAMS